MKIFNLIFLLILSVNLHATEVEVTDQERMITVDVSIDKNMLPDDAEKWTLYVYAAKPNTRLPLSNFKGKLSQLPMKVELKQNMYLLPHLTLKQAEDVVIVAKATKHKNPHNKDGTDIMGFSPAISFENANKLKAQVTIDQMDKKR